MSLALDDWVIAITRSGRPYPGLNGASGQVVRLPYEKTESAGPNAWTTTGCRQYMVRLEYVPNGDYPKPGRIWAFYEDQLRKLNDLEVLALEAPG